MKNNYFIRIAALFCLMQQVLVGPMAYAQEGFTAYDIEIGRAHV